MDNQFLCKNCNQLNNPERTICEFCGEFLGESDEYSNGQINDGTDEPSIGSTEPTFDLDENPESNTEEGKKIYSDKFATTNNEIKGFQQENGDQDEKAETSSNPKATASSGGIAVSAEDGSHVNVAENIQADVQAAIVNVKNGSVVINKQDESSQIQFSELLLSRKS